MNGGKYSIRWCAVYYPPFCEIRLKCRVCIMKCTNCWYRIPPPVRQSACPTVHQSSSLKSHSMPEIAWHHDRFPWDWLGKLQNEADPTSRLCSSQQKLLKEKLLVPKVLDTWMHNLCSFPEFSFGVRTQPGQAWPVSYHHLIIAFFFLIRSKGLL